ncbi:Protein THEM6 [Hondaea fermentalgiana]|uniref:Protein THEM6 n=1 Tax=Hondaea fermentalgiana TaxID=2315210 RepID=A0A2R5G7Y2_9STRA|nr:Protein THEM6 [Hondaea fermentalgiana]|eukprot:GBG24141.1 Protein THEM6 [Hondaea fermentalgiana]
MLRGFATLIVGAIVRWLAQRGWTSRKLHSLTMLALDTPHIWRSRAGFPAITDVDFNLHMNNASYPYAAELARWHLCGMNGLANEIFLNGYTFMIGSQAFRYRIWTTIDAFDDKWMYMTQTFTSVTASAEETPKVVYAQGLVRAITISTKGGRKMSPREALTRIGVSSDVLDDLEKRKPTEHANIDGFLRWDEGTDVLMKSFGGKQSVQDDKTK